MARFYPIIFLTIALGGCHGRTSFEQTNASTDAALDAAAANISERDGADRSMHGAGAKAAGEQMRSAATERPR